MKTKFAMLAALTLAGCGLTGPSEEESRQFITSMLTTGSEGESAWEFSRVDLGDRWKWHETDHFSVNDPQAQGSIETETDYEVDPAKLRLPVKVANSRVFIECEVRGCVSQRAHNQVFNKTMQRTFDGGTVDRPLDQVVWRVGDSADAERLGKAVTALLEKQGAKKSAF